MIDPSQFSPEIRQHPEAANAQALGRVALAKRRIQSVLDRDVVAHPKTLEQKIAEQGPKPQRVDPHLIGLAIKDLLNQHRIREHHHSSTGTAPWYANIGTKADPIQKRLDELAPLYRQIRGYGFGNLVGDALEVIVFKCLDNINKSNPRYAYQGHFNLDQPKTNGRYKKTQPPKSIGPYTTQKEADFYQFGYDAGTLCIECKNYREWLYPNNSIIKELIYKSYELRAIPVLIHRRIHYTTLTNFLEPAGIIAHETYYQYFPEDARELADRAKHRRSLGFTDITASEEPHPRTVRFFQELLPRIVDLMAQRWSQHRSALFDYATDQINLAQLYSAIGSPAGGKWQDFSRPE